jgi:benzoate-CoA ligase family protein
MVPDVFNAATYFVDRHVPEGRGDKIAIECGDARVTYRALHERVNQVGNALRDHADIRPEERLLLLLLDTPEFFYCFFGAIKIGAVPIPTSTLWKSADYEYLLNDSRARTVLVSEALLPRLQEIPLERLRHVRELIVADSSTPRRGDGLRTLEALSANASTKLDAEPTSKDDVAFWLYSSGSTGFPKGCVHLQHDMMVCTEHYARGVLDMTEADRCFSVAKLFFAYGLGNAGYFPLGVGATTILWPGAPTAANVYDVIERHRPTLLFSVPTNYAMLLAHRREGTNLSNSAADATPTGAKVDFDLSSLRYGVSAGEALPPALFERFKERFGVEILDGIGSTEVLHMFISNRPGALRPGASGVLVPGYDAKLVDDEGHPVPTGEIGHLLVKGDSICAGYWNRHEKTKETIQGAWIRTGDKYHQDADGYFWYDGRSDDMLKVGGIWVSPVEVENALVEHPAVLECGVASKQDRDGLAKPFAFIVLHSERDPSHDLATELQQFVRAKLAEYKRPRWVEFVEELPKTATGKIQRYKLRERIAGAEQGEAT